MICVTYIFPKPPKMIEHFLHYYFFNFMSLFQQIRVDRAFYILESIHLKPPKVFEQLCFSLFFSLFLFVSLVYQIISKNVKMLFWCCLLVLSHHNAKNFLKTLWTGYFLLLFFFGLICSDLLWMLCWAEWYPAALVNCTRAVLFSRFVAAFNSVPRRPKLCL